MTKAYDVAVFGGGPAGYWAAVAAATRGRRVALVEAREVGGVCLNRGCVPLASLMHYLSLVSEVRTLEQKGFGVRTGGISVSFANMLKAVIEKLVKPTSERARNALESMGVDILSGEAKMTSEKMAKVSGQVVQFERAVIATGLEWSAAEGAKPCTSFVEIEEVPSSIAILGANHIGSALASLLNLAGSEVTVIEEGTRALRWIDEEVVEFLLTSLAADGIKVYVGATAISVSGHGDLKEVRFVCGGEEKRVAVEEVFDAATSRPNLAVLGNLAIDTRNGYVAVNERMRTSVPNVFAAGDVTGVAPFAHVAIMQGFVAGENASGGDASLNYETVPYFAFTRPEVMSVGLSEAEAAERGYDVAVARLPLSANVAASARHEGGFVKVVVEKEYGGILGIHAVGPAASELANEASLALSLESTAESLAYAFHSHPALGEALRDAAIRALRLSG